MSEIEKLELKTEIKCAIVYQKGVQITQTGSINLSNGEQLIKISNLPETLDKESIRVKGLGNGKIINISVEFNSKKEYKTEEYKKLNEEREKLEKEIKKYQIELDRTKELIEKIKKTESEFYDNWAKAYALGEVDLSNFDEFYKQINKNYTDKIDKVESLEDKLKKLKIEIQVIQNKISKLGPIEEVHNFYEVNINVNVLEKGAFDIELRYTMFEAWWTPFYDAVLIENKTRLTVMANVYNRSGQDWKNIELEISTASLKPIKLIKPEPLILKEHIPYVAKADMAPKKKAKMPLSATRATSGSFADVNLADDDSGIEREKEDAEIEAEPMPEITETYAEVSENIGVQSFKIPDLIDIPSDKNPHPVNLTVQELETEKKYFWSSAIPENVIIRDTLINGDLLLLAGNVKIYFKEEFLGETSIPLIAPKENFKLGTRVSYDLKIDKKLIDRSKAKKAIKGRLKNKYEYRITIKNLNEVTEDLTLYDKIPHSSSENIKVEIEEIVPDPSKKNLGVLKWKFNLKGIKEKTINYKYYIDYKKGIQITPPLP